ncbi:MAG: c-type cytochrome domain-containing protein, partial [Gimesia chilikensis]
NESRAESEKPQQVERVRFFEEHVRPLLLKHCIDCHGPKKQFAELRLDSREHLLKGGESGPGIVVNQPEDSLLISAVKRESLEMPPDRTLSPDEIKVLTTWIEQGALWPDSARLADTKSVDFSRHWSFQPIQNPPRPAVKNTSWPQNDIDYFILARLEAEQLSPSPPAYPATLLKRMHWDLTG